MHELRQSVLDGDLEPSRTARALLLTSVAPVEVLMSFERSVVSVVALTVTMAACINTPQLSTLEERGDPSGGSSVSTARGGMVLVPAATLVVVNPAVAPQGKGEGEKGKDDGKGDKGGGGGGGSGSGDPVPGAVDAGTTQLSVPSFWMDVREVTAGSYRECLDTGACTAPTTQPGCTLAEGRIEAPINCVSVEQARAFCTWSNKRLARNDEWSAAAAGSAGRAYPWGTEPPAADRLNACGSECAAAGMYATSDGHAGIATGGTFPLGRSPDGVDDLGGNVAEWVDSSPGPVTRGASYADTDATFVGSLQLRIDAAGPTIGFRCTTDR